VKIGALHVTWLTSQKRRDGEAAVLTYLAHHPKARELTAKLARSEIKNYLAGLAEDAEVPFDDPVSCLRNVWNLYQYGKSPAAQARDHANGLVFHGEGCPGHTTGPPAESCSCPGKEIDHS
jgi:hypothetical protein